MNDIPKVTGEQVRDACLAAKITYIPHHECGGCGFEVSYTVESGALYFNPACDCSSRWSGREPCDWEEAADWINMQGEPKHRIAIAARFGLSAAIPAAGREEISGESKP